MKRYKNHILTIITIIVATGVAYVHATERGDYASAHQRALLLSTCNNNSAAEKVVAAACLAYENYLILDGVEQRMTCLQEPELDECNSEKIAQLLANFVTVRDALLAALARDMQVVMDGGETIASMSVKYSGSAEFTSVARDEITRDVFDTGSPEGSYMALSSPDPTLGIIGIQNTGALTQNNIVLAIIVPAYRSVEERTYYYNLADIAPDGWQEWFDSQ